MTPSETEPNASPVKLLPHQSKLVETFFDPASKRVLLLRGDVGLGKSTALIAIAGRLLRERPIARALFMVPGSLQLQYVEMLRDAGTPAVLVNRYQFREMLDSTTGGELWPRGMVAVLSRDFAREPDIRDRLAETYWDLVIVDEAHSFRGARAEQTLRQVGASAERVVLATLPELELPRTFSEEDATVLEWRRDQIVDHHGARLDTAPQSILHEVPFRYSPAELSLQDTVRGLREILGAGTRLQRFKALSLHRVLESSPAALEGALRSLTVRLEAEDGVDVVLEVQEEEEVEDGLAEGLNRATAEKAAEIAARALQEIDAVESDSKMGTFVGLLSQLNEVTLPSRRICVLTEYVDTLYYLAAEIDARGMACQLLHSGLNSKDRRRSLSLFSNIPDILVATNRVMKEGVNLHDVTDLVWYDVPEGKVGLQEVVGRFIRFGRSSRLNVHVLTPSNGSRGSIQTKLAILRELFGVIPDNIT